MTSDDPLMLSQGSRSAARRRAGSPSPSTPRCSAPSPPSPTTAAATTSRAGGTGAPRASRSAGWLHARAHHGATRLSLGRVAACTCSPRRHAPPERRHARAHYGATPPPFASPQVRELGGMLDCAADDAAREAPRPIPLARARMDLHPPLAGAGTLHADCLPHCMLIGISGADGSSSTCGGEQ